MNTHTLTQKNTKRTGAIFLSFLLLLLVASGPAVGQDTPDTAEAVEAEEGEGEGAEEEPVVTVPSAPEILR